MKDSLSEASKSKAERITQFRSANGARLADQNMLITDISPNGIPIYRSILNANASITTGAAKLQSGAIGLLLEGKNLTLGVWDDGKIQNHIELGDRVISNEGESFADHATHVTGTLIASGINPAAKGMAPKAKVMAHYFDNDEVEMSALAMPDQTTLLFSSHSYGQVTGWYRSDGNWKWAGDPSISQDEDFNFGFYGSHAQAVDQITYLAPYYTVVWAAGNDRAEPGNGTHPPDCNNGTGYDCIISDAVAKNIITVGAVDKVLNYVNPSSVAMSYFSSWGPTDDGRIKPDVVGDGVNLFSLSATGTNGYVTFSGTSMATPNVAGSLALLQELYSKLHAGNFMKASTLKAIAIHTAKETGTFPGPDYSFGWGLLDVEAGANLLLHEDDVNTKIKELTLNNNETMDLVLSPQANQKITITISWTDPAGKPVADKLDPTDLMLKNDLDIKLVDENGSQILPWVLDPGNPSKGAIKGNNNRDNVEKIEFDSPALKAYHLVITHKGQLINLKQDFSLIINYQSTQNAAQTYYWIGDTGDWSDASHWSLRSGGTPGSKVPTSLDNVIVDENSFDGVGVDQINFSANQSVGALIWINSKQSGIALNNYNLTVNQSLSLASAEFQSYGSGTILLGSSSNGKVNFIDNKLGRLNVTIAGGNWTWMGNALLNNLTLAAGSLTVNNAKILAKNLISNSANARIFKASNSTFELTDGSLMSQTNLTFNLKESIIKTNGSLITLDWNQINWNGALEVVSGKTLIKGNNTIDSLVIDKGCELILASGTEQLIRELNVISESQAPVRIGSDVNASVNFTSHKKYCFDFLTVTNVEAKGVGVANAGENGILNNAKGWSALNCNDVLFADFEVIYPCEKGVTLFKDKSTGSPKQWKWTFPGSVNLTGSAVNFSFAKVGTYPVILEVSNDNSIRAYTEEVQIKSNTQNANQIVLNSNEMYSFNQATSYQWFRNDTIIPNENKRLYPYNGEDGTFMVITYDDGCSRISELLTITALEDEPDLVINVYPNPSDQEITIESKTDEVKTINIMDLIGRTVLSTQSNQREIIISTHHFNQGIYLIETTVANNKYRNKILIKH